MATRAKRGSRNGIEWRTANDGTVTYRGVLNLAATGKQNGPWVKSNAEAKAWRVKAQGEAQKGTLRPSNRLTLRDGWQAFYDAAKKGTATPAIRPSTLRGYERAWRLRINPVLGAHRLEAIRRADLQALVDHWAAEGMSPATIRNTLDPVRTIYRRALVRDLVTINPTTNLEVPKVSNARERFATREESAELLTALPDAERALWSTALYGGLRRGEIRALRWAHVSLADGLIRVQRSWDDDEDDGPPKSKAAIRKVPITKPLRAALEAHRDATGRGGDDLVFGRTATEPFIPSTVRNRALAAWKVENTKRTKADPEAKTLTPIGLHECRHTCASLLIAAGANAKGLSVVMGHTSITITFDRYGHLMPGGEGEVGRLLDVFLAA